MVRNCQVESTAPADSPRVLTQEQKDFIERRRRLRRDKRKRDSEEEEEPIDVFGARTLGIFEPGCALREAEPDPEVRVVKGS